jgi:hypothetical protein
MISPKAPTLLPVSKKRFSTNALGFGVSLLFHGGLLLLIGGIVLVQNSIPKVPFQAAVDAPAAPWQPEEPVLAEEPPTPAELSPNLEQAPPSSSANPNTATAQLPEVIASTATSLAAYSPPSLGSFAALAGGPAMGAGKTGTGPGLRNMASVFGSPGVQQGALVGRFYDLKQTADGKPSAMAYNAIEQAKGFVSGPSWLEYKETKLFDDTVKKFANTWDERLLAPYFQAPEPLSAFQIFLPRMMAKEAPKAFNVNCPPSRWLVHYKGTVTAPVSGQFRFVGFGDDIMLVRFNGKNVLDGCWRILDPGANSKTDQDLGPVLAGHPRHLVGGDWFSISAGQSYPMEVLIGESPGGQFLSFLLIQEKGKDYPNRPGKAGPILPLFQTARAQLPSYQAEVDGPTIAPEPMVFGAN